MICVRHASLDDLESLIAVYTAAWREGFADMFSAATFVDDQFEVDRIAEVRDLLLDDSITTLVAEIDGRIVGFSGVSIENGTPCLDDMWVHPHGWGRGAAQALIAAIEDEHRSTGNERLTTWVPEDSARARHFIEKMGWHPTGHAEPMGLYPEQPQRLFEYDRVIV
jgi:GNAT superfamily N-acetyltransferase